MGSILNVCIQRWLEIILTSGSTGSRTTPSSLKRLAAFKSSTTLSFVFYTHTYAPYVDVNIMYNLIAQHGVRLSIKTATKYCSRSDIRASRGKEPLDPSELSLVRPLDKILVQVKLETHNFEKPSTASCRSLNNC